MFDGLSIDQLRTFLAAVDEGSFSAAGRRLKRAQSVVSQTIANLEAQLRVRLFNRTGRLPQLTEHGRALVDRARAVVRHLDGLSAFAGELAGGVEHELSIAVDVMFPTEVLTRAVTAFRAQFPNTPLRVYMEALGSLAELVVDRRCSFAITGTLQTPPQKLVKEGPISTLEFVFVASSTHPLARYKGPIPSAEIHKHVHLVLSDRSKLTEGRDFGVSRGAVWRIADHGARLALLRAGLGWCGVPRYLVSAELERRELVAIDVRDMLRAPAGSAMSPPYVMPMWTLYDPEFPPGPAGRWLLGRIKDGSTASGQSNTATGGRRPRRQQF